MKQYQTKANLLRWSDIIKAWLDSHPQPYFFNTPLSNGTTRVALRPAITGHILHNFPDTGIDAQRLAAIWDISKLTHVKDNTWCFCLKDYQPEQSQPGIFNAPTVSFNNDTHLHYSVTDETILTKLLDLINAGLISDNSAILHLKLSPELYVRMDALLESYPNIGFESDPATYTYHLL